MMTPPNRTHKLIIYALIILAFALRAYRLDAQSYWIDEAWTVHFAHFSLAEMWHLLRSTEPFPPLYHPSTIYWVKLLGDSEYALRFYSLVFGVLAIPFTYRLGKELGDSRLGMLAALLMAVAPYQVWHSQEARMYSMLTAASAMSMWGFVNLWQRGGWRGWLTYVIGTEWAIMTHYHGVVLLGIQGLFVLLTWRHRWRSQQFIAWIVASAVILLIISVWLIFGGNLLQRYLNWIEQPTLGETYIRSAIAYSVGELVPRPQAIPMSLVFVGLYMIGLVYASRRAWGTWRGREVLGLLLAFTVAPNLAAWLYGEIRTTVYFERYLIMVQIGYLLAVSAGVLAIADGLGRRLGRVATVIASLTTLALLGISGLVLTHYYFDPVYARPDWRTVASTVQGLELAGDAIIITGDGGEKAFGYYYQGTSPIFIDFNTPVPPETQARQIIQEIAAKHRRIWYTPYGVGIDTVLEDWLTHNAYPAWQSWLGRKRLALYAGSQSVLDRLEKLNAIFATPQGQALTLHSVAMPARPVAAGDVLPLTLTWSASSELHDNYKLSVRLSNEQGDIFAQSDWPPLAAVGGTSSWEPQQTVTDRRGLWIPPDVPPGGYTLRFIVYHPQSGQPAGQPAVIPGLQVGPAERVTPVEVLPIPDPIQQPLGSLNLIGYALPHKISPGEDITIWLYWQATNQELPLPGSILRLGLSGEGETASADFDLIDSVGLPATWRAGQVRRAVYHLPTSPRLSGEHATLEVVLLSEKGEVEAEATLAQIELQSRPRQFETPRMAHPTAISFENPPLLKLIGYDLPERDLAPGDALAVTLYWQAETEMEIDYTVFVQLLDQDWQVVAQQDSPPQTGAAPTTTWLPGEILADAYTLPLPQELAKGEYRLIAGMYNPATGNRLSVSTGGDFVDLGMVTLR
ncbi:MAG: hypothetical protein Kow0063_32230 [Anaerolineae bacterium]